MSADQEKKPQVAIGVCQAVEKPIIVSQVQDITDRNSAAEKAGESLQGGQFLDPRTLLPYKSKASESLITKHKSNSPAARPKKRKLDIFS